MSSSPNKFSLRFLPLPISKGLQIIDTIENLLACDSLSAMRKTTTKLLLLSIRALIGPGRRKFGKVWADVKSEQYEVADSGPKSVKFKDGLSQVENEARLESAIPWYEEFPKRWIIVILCFSAFLLCNMDRVNMSIAILPMSSEYNWNPTTVGLIQSSFFWGYLLTQIAGGIWADTVGGKLVLTFGVVWCGLVVYSHTGYLN